MGIAVALLLCAVGWFTYRSITGSAIGHRYRPNGTLELGYILLGMGCAAAVFAYPLWLNL